MHFKALVLLLLASAFGLSAAMMANSWLQSRDGNSSNKTSTVELHAAATSMTYGKVLSADDLKVLEWPEDNIPEGAIKVSEDLVGKIMIREVHVGELIFDHKVSDELPGSSLSAMVAPNRRAVTIRVNDVAGVAGFLLPGNRVDVLATLVVDRRAQTRTLLQNLKVLAVDQQSDALKDEPLVVRAVTLEATLEEAQRLVSATEEGTIQLILRNPDDKSREELEPPVTETDTPVTEPIESLTQREPPEIGAAVPEEPQKKPVTRKKPQVSVIRGTSVSSVSVNE